MEQLEKFKEDYKILLTKYKNDNIEDNIGLDILKDFSKKSNSSRSVGWMNCD